MGNILKLLARDGDCCALPKQDIFVDFESASPIPEEAELYNEAEAILDESLKILERIEGYKGKPNESSWKKTLFMPLSDANKKIYFV